MFLDVSHPNGSTPSIAMSASDLLITSTYCATHQRYRAALKDRNDNERDGVCHVEANGYKNYDSKGPRRKDSQIGIENGDLDCWKRCQVEQLVDVVHFQRLCDVIKGDGPHVFSDAESRYCREVSTR